MPPPKTTDRPERSRERSTEARDYQHLPQPIGALAKRFEDGFVIPEHAHDRDQLVFARGGVMRVETPGESWIVPPDRAIYLPAGRRHSVRMHGAVEMPTLYIDRAAFSARWDVVRVLAVSPLLRALILALAEEPVDYLPGSRGDRVARMIEFELREAEPVTLRVPLPEDPRLQKICAAILAAPADRRTLEAWADMAGASPRTLARLFQRDLGMRFKDWRAQARLQSAMEALARGEPIAVIAAKHGYLSPSAFTAAFVKATGQPPTTLAKQHGLAGQ